jgi:hypothetical protein
MRLAKAGKEGGKGLSKKMVYTSEEPVTPEVVGKSCWI